jgi:hypothetical protein
MGRSNDTLSALIAFCRRLDVDLKLEQQIARKNNLNVPTARSSTPRSTGTTTANTATTPMPSAAPLNPHSFHRSSTPRIGITAAERERYMAQGLFFYCKEQGHVSRDYPKKNPRVNAVANVAEKEQEFKLESKN